MKLIVKTNNNVNIKNDNKKKLLTWGKLIIIITSVIVIALVGTFVFINMKLNTINHPEIFETIPPEAEYFEQDGDGIPASYTAVMSEMCYAGEICDIKETSDTDEITDIDNTSDIVWSTEGSIIEDKDITNILLIGQDRRPGDSRARSDSMIIATINKKNNTIKMTSLMRDLYVQIPGYSDNRINAAYAFGGRDLLDATIEKNFQVHIDFNIEVDFDGFQQVIDKIGGIDILINAEEANYLEDRGFKGLFEGTVHMNGLSFGIYSYTVCGEFRL